MTRVAGKERLGVTVKAREVTVGLEVHAQINTARKIFCGCATTFDAPPNTLVCPVCLGLPGALPVLNGRAVELAVKAGLAAGCRVPGESVFARKNYFYPDLPKGYQITQYDRPLCLGGSITLELNGETRAIRLARMHLEEDAGKSLHPGDSGGDFSLVDFNRCGIPLLEIVTEPEIGSPSEAVACLGAIKRLLEYLDVCDGDMERGSLRCDVNVSIARGSDGHRGVRTEIKNLNSFRNLERSLIFEIERQGRILSDGGNVRQETLLWDEVREECVPMRSKEEAHDYRYFPEPDLPPLFVSEELKRKIEGGLPELPWKRSSRFEGQYGMSSTDARLLTSTRALADYYEKCVNAGADPKLAGNWIKTEVLRVLKEQAKSVGELRAGPESLAELLRLVGDGEVSGTAAKTVLDEMVETGESAAKIVREKDLKQIREPAAIGPAVSKVLDEESGAVEQYLKGKEQTFQFLVGRVMRALGGKADPLVIQDVLKDKLARLKHKR